jgi:phosphate transport system permease protein
MMHRRKEEQFFLILMYLSLIIVMGSLIAVFSIVLFKGLSSMSLSMITEVPKGGYYLGKEGGILNAIIGSLYLAAGSIILAIIMSLPVAWYLNKAPCSKFCRFIRDSLDIANGIPSLIYGSFAFLLMVFFHQRASLGWGIITVALFISPILIRAMDEVMQMVPQDIRHAAESLGSTDIETLFHAVTKQALPGIITAIIIAFGRAIGDAAAVLFTAGYTDNIPTSLSDPVATLPLAIFFQLSSPFPEVQGRAYACGLILLVIVFILCMGSRIISRRLSRYTIH